jgi:hemoglobin
MQAIRQVQTPDPAHSKWRICHAADCGSVVAERCRDALRTDAGRSTLGCRLDRHAHDPGEPLRPRRGQPAIREVVEQFYARVLADEDLAPYFVDADVTQVKRHQVLLLSQVLGGPAEYDGRDLGEAHRGLGITSDHYDKVVGHLVAVLSELGADDELLAAAGAVVGGVKADIVESGAASS